MQTATHFMSQSRLRTKGIRHATLLHCDCTSRVVPSVECIHRPPPGLSRGRPVVQPSRAVGKQADVEVSHRHPKPEPRSLQVRLLGRPALKDRAEAWFVGQAGECRLLPFGQKVTLCPIRKDILAYELDVHADLTTMGDGKDGTVRSMGDVEAQPARRRGQPRLAERMLVEAQLSGGGVKVSGQQPTQPSTPRHPADPVALEVKAMAAIMLSCGQCPRQHSKSVSVHVEGSPPQMDLALAQSDPRADQLISQARRASFTSVLTISAALA